MEVYFMDDLTILNEIHKGVTMGMASLEEVAQKSSDEEFKETCPTIYDNLMQKAKGKDDNTNVKGPADTKPDQSEINMQKESAKQIVDDLMKAIEGFNDHDKMNEILQRIDNPIELEEVNRLLQQKERLKKAYMNGILEMEDFSEILRR